MRERLLAKLEENMEEIMDSPTLFSLDSKFISQLNLLLLHHLVNGRGMRGVYVCLERPSFYVKKILKVKGIDLDRVTFIDAIQGISGEMTSCNGARTRLVDNPFSGEMLEHLCSPKGKLAGEEGDIDFIILDSISALACYMDRNSLDRMLEELSEREGVVTLILMDGSLDRELYSIVRRHSKREFRLDDDLSLDMVEPTGGEPAS